jgi:uncharacterized protein YoxC
MAHPAAPFADAGAWILVQAAAQVAAQAAAAGDTLIVRQAPIDPGWFERFQETLRALMTLAILVLTVAVVPAAWSFRKSYHKVSDLLDRVYADVNPIAHHASRIAENVDYVSTAVRADTERASALVADAERRLRAALERAEARARDLEALLDVAQAEAERTLVTAASTVAGVREGVAALRADLAAAVLPGASAPGRPARAGGRTREEAAFADATRPDDYDDLAADDLMADDLALVDVRAAERPRVRRRPE